jgi:hypothetical protein
LGTIIEGVGKGGVTLILKNGNETIEFLVGDTFVTKEGKEYLVISSDGFCLSDEGSKANFIIVDLKYGDMEGYGEDLNDIWRYYDISKVIPNPYSSERRNRK